MQKNQISLSTQKSAPFLKVYLKSYGCLTLHFIYFINNHMCAS